MIIKREEWNACVELNSKDDYSKACVDVAREAMRILDEDDTPLHGGYYPDLHTSHGLICKADDNIDAGGITGAMAGFVAEMISQFHSRGEEFKTEWNKPYNPDAEGVINPAIVTIGTK